VDEVIAWEEVPPVLPKTKAYQHMVSAYWDKICRVAHNFTDISYTSGNIMIDGNRDSQCAQERCRKMEAIPPIKVYSVGRLGAKTEIPVKVPG